MIADVWCRTALLRNFFQCIRQEVLDTFRSARHYHLLFPPGFSFSSKYICKEKQTERCPFQNIISRSFEKRMLKQKIFVNCPVYRCDHNKSFRKLTTSLKRACHSMAYLLKPYKGKSEKSIDKL